MKNMFVINFGKKKKKIEGKKERTLHINNIIFVACCSLKKNEKKWRPTSNPLDRGNEEFTLTKQS